MTDPVDTGSRTSHGLPSPKRRVGHYEIIRQIGRGGMATVYLARQVALDRNVALKELSSFHASSPEFAERFLRESRLAGSLNHPNIVTVLEYFEEGGTPYIAMEYVRGGSLRPYVGRLGLAQFAGVMEGVLAGLTHAETMGVVHRDLKPENLMVTSDGRVKIADFGIAKATQSAGTGAFLTATGTTVGTPTYMAPEQAMAGDVGMWTDLYSVGVMAWEHVVGHVPFHDTDAPMVLLMRQVNEKIPPAAEVNPDVDEELSEWIDRLLIKDPRERTGSAIDAWEQLEEIVIGLLGPRWRRDARLPEHAATLDTPRALTPAPFSVKSPTPPPTPSAPAPAASVAEPDYLTFGSPAPSAEPAEAAAPAPPAPEPPTPEAPAPQPVATESSPPSVPAVAAAMSAPTATPVPEVTPAVDDGYMTFGAATAPPVAPAPAAEPEPARPEPAAPEPAASDPAPPAAPEPVIPLAAGSETLAPERIAPAPAPEPVATPTPEPLPAAPEPAPEPTEPIREPEPVAQAAVPSTPRTAPRRASSGAAGRVAGVAVLVAIVAAALGFVIAPSSSKTSPSAGPAMVGSASAGPLSISLPAGWSHAASQPVAHLPLSNQLVVSAAAPDAGTLVMGTTTTSDASLLPASFVSALSDPPTPQVVTLGKAQFYRYLDVTPSGASTPETVYALPTSVGSVVAVCQASGSSASFASTCERVVGTLQVSGKVFGLGPNSAYASALSGAMSTLTSARSSAQAKLGSAKSPGAQASAAGSLAGAYTRAGAAVNKLAPGPAAQSANTAIATALAKIGAGYTALGHAAAHHDSGGYTRARSAITSATNDLSAALRQLTKLGYSIG